MSTRINRSQVITLTLSSLLGVAAAFGAGQAQAAAARSVAVSYRDLDLSRTADVHKLYRRLEQAAATVCMAEPLEELTRLVAYQRCYNAALDSAVLEVHSPELLALYRASGATAPGRG